MPALEALRQHDPAARVAAADVHALPFRTGAFEAVLSFGVLEHFEHGMAPALAEAFRVLAPGGTLVVTVPVPNVVWRAVRWRRVLAATAADRARYFETAYKASTLADAIVRAGFDLRLVEPVGHSFTLWGLGRPFRGRGHYETSRLAEFLGRAARRVAPSALAFATLVVAARPSHAAE
jgi:SAM-dependent methyltransferase